MEYVEINGQFPDLSSCAVTLGKFDGIHRGHRKLIEEILQYKKENNTPAVVLAFASGKKSVFTKEERKKILSEMGVDILLECPLDEKFRHIKAEQFIRQILVGDLHAACVVVGEDYRFGFERKGTPELLEEYGRKYSYETRVIPKEMNGNRKISSTFIREELNRGNMKKVSELLGRDFFVAGTVEHGRGLGHKKFFPTTNLIPSAQKLMPPNGVYVTTSIFEKKSFRGITNVGYKPTVGGNFLGVETFLFDCDENLYGRECVVNFHRFLRPEHKFSSFEALKQQIQKDIEEAQKDI
nr:bifunctional riboflavin kinase/FAD synthetase [uncultured Blautia sp.]